MKKNSKIQIIINDITVESIVLNRTESDIALVITKPYKNISGGSHIPYFARAGLSFNGEYGDNRLKQILAKVYELGKFIADRFDDLKNKYEFHFINSGVLSKNESDIKNYKKKKTELKKQFRSGKIDNLEYQKLLNPIQKEKKIWEFDISNTSKDFFEKYFPMTVPYGTRDEVINILSGKKELK